MICGGRFGGGKDACQGDSGHGLTDSSGINTQFVHFLWFLSRRCYSRTLLQKEHKNRKNPFASF